MIDHTVALYCIVDDLLKAVGHRDDRRRSRAPGITTKRSATASPANPTPPSPSDLLDQVPPPPPTAVRAAALDAHDPLVVRDSAYEAWRQTLSEEERARPDNVGLRVSWVWTASQMRQAPDMREFRVYLQHGHLNRRSGRVLTVPPGKGESTVEMDIVVEASAPADAYAGNYLQVGGVPYWTDKPVAGASVEGLRFTWYDQPKDVPDFGFGFQIEWGPDPMPPPPKPLKAVTIEHPKSSVTWPPASRYVAAARLRGNEGRGRRARDSRVPRQCRTRRAAQPRRRHRQRRPPPASTSSRLTDSVTDNSSPFVYGTAPLIVRRGHQIVTIQVSGGRRSER